ncbi:TPR-like protein [Auriscalpium vulgare]|uniref:TPR-like protein n=1 Tax=Auriscalpium vulgare TaxID=40419 RepID=A0ACB8R4I8_9AGAM|nr:TPR-like protein [Auriscalpium vulgare]
MKRQHKQKKSWIAPFLAGSLTDEINKCDGLVFNIIEKYKMSLMFSIRCHQYTGSLRDSKAEQTLVFHFIHIIERLKVHHRTPELLFPHAFFGRDQELQKIIQTIAKEPHTKIVILGPAGIGKTTLARAVLSSELVVQKFETERYLVACDACSSIDALIAGVAQAFGIIERTASSLMSRVIFHLTQKQSIICLDGFEKMWSKDSQPQASQFLEMMVSTKATLLLTLRGSERPVHINWTILPVQLYSIDSSAAQELWKFVTMGKECDDTAKKLMQTVDYHPQAVTILASLTNIQPVESLWRQWQKKGVTTILDYDENLMLSINLSLATLEKKAKPETMRMLSIMSILPDGMRSSHIDVLQGLFPSLGSPWEGLVPLFQCGLMYESAEKQIKIVGITREFCSRNYSPSQADFLGIWKYYFSLAVKGFQPMNNLTYIELKSELRNIEAILVRCLENSEATSELAEQAVEGARALTHFYAYIGLDSPSLIDFATEKAKAISEVQYAYCLWISANLDLAMSRVAEAEKKCIEALEIHEKKRDIFGEASDLCQYGEIHVRNDEISKALECFQRSKALYKLYADNGGSCQGLANILTHLGNIYKKKNQLHEASLAYLEALDHHTRLQDDLGQANALKGLGNVFLKSHSYDQAKAKFEEAISLYKNENDFVGQANCLTYLGEVYLQQNRLLEAETNFKYALTLYEQINDRLGEANTFNYVGNVLYKKAEYQHAERYFSRALALHKNVKNTRGEAESIKGIARILTKSNKKNTAIEKFLEAKELYAKAHDAPGQGSCLGNIGRICYVNEELQRAKEYFDQSYLIYLESENSHGQANILSDIADLKRKLNDYEGAEQDYWKAWHLHKAAEDYLGQCNDLRGLGVLYHKHMKNIIEAEKAYKKAIKAAQFCNIKMLEKVQTEFDMLKKH